MQAADRRSIPRFTRLCPHQSYVPIERTYTPSHWDETYHCWIGRPRTPPVMTPHSDDLHADEVGDFVYPNYFHELTDEDLYYIVSFAWSRELRPSGSDSD
jgi:hypothetical protein